MTVAEQRRMHFRNGETTFCTCSLGNKALTYYQNLPDESDMERGQRERRAAQNARVNALYKDAGVPPRYRNFSLKGYKTMVQGDVTKQVAIQAVEDYYRGKQEKPGLLLYGPTGVGKTGMLSPLFLYLLHERQHSGLWIQYNDLLASLKEFDLKVSRGSATGVATTEVSAVAERIDLAKIVDYLFIDDLGDPDGRGTASEYTRDVLFRIIDHRHNWGMPMLITTNLSPAQIGEQYHERVLRRLEEACRFVPVAGRKIKEMGK